MSDLDEVSDTDSNSTTRDSYQNPPPPQDGPYLEIVEQPQSRGFRFRYACEGKSHGGLQGVNSRREKKSFPTVRINRFKGPARIIVSLVTDGKDPRPHAHELIGKNCQNGTCSVTIKGENMTVSFPNLGVRHVTKKSVTKILTERIRESMKVDRMITGMLGQDADHIFLTHEEEERAKKEAELQARNMPLSVVRLRFQAYLQDAKGVYSLVLPHVISNPIYDSKAPCASVLKICRMDKVGGCCTGNEEVFLLCDKVQKDDIAVRFYEQDEDGNIKWEDYGNFAPHDVHRQYAIVFRTPSYMETNIDRPVAVHVQLKRFSDGEVSDPKTFTYYPQQTDLEDIVKKRKKIIPHFGDSDFINSMGGGGGSKNQQGSGGGGGGGGAGVGGGGIMMIGNNSSNNGVFHKLQHPIFHRNEPGQQPQPIHVLPSGWNSGSWIGAHQSIPVRSRLEADAACAFDMTNPGCLISRGVSAARPAPPFVGKEPVSPTAGLKAKPSTAPLPVKGLSSGSDQLAEESAKPLESQTDSAEKIDARLVTLARLLSAKTVQITKSLQSYAASGDVRFLLQPVRGLISTLNEDGDNCLHLSVIHQQTEAARNLLSVVSTLPPDVLVVNESNELGQTPLYLSIATKQIPLLTMLLSHGADYAVRDKEGNTFLHLAARRGYEQCLEQFLNNWNHDTGPTVNDLNFEGFSALHLAVLGGHLSCVKLLLSVGGADVNLSDARSGRTALHHAVDMDNLAIVGHLILESGAEVNQAAYDGNTALHMAVTSNRLGVAALLMAAEADPDAENMDFESEDDDEDDDEDYEVDNDDEEVTRPANQPENNEEAEQAVGQSPKDLAAGNPKMLRILNGEPYSLVSEKMLESSAAEVDLAPESVATTTRLKSVYDSGISSISFLSQQFSGLTERGDLHMLDSMTRKMLAKVLDPIKSGSDWRELAKRLGLGPLENAFQFQSSPTEALLDNYEVINGTSVMLKRCLLDMGRLDAMNIIEEALPSKEATSSCKCLR